jgi:hypothetical protein
MESLHNPSVPLGPSSSHDEADTGDYKKLMRLMEEKERVEKELDALGSVLDSVCFCSSSDRLRRFPSWH